MAPKHPIRNRPGPGTGAATPEPPVRPPPSAPRCRSAPPSDGAGPLTWPGKLLITCRTAFSLPPGHRDRFVFRRLGRLTRSGAAGLALWLPALRLLDEPQRDPAWRLTAGHPRTMEYLDSLLVAGLNFC